MSDVLGGIFALIIAASWVIIIFFGSLGLSICTMFFFVEQLGRLFL